MSNCDFVGASMVKHVQRHGVLIAVKLASS
jgi:hypothetical protein